MKTIASSIFVPLVLSDQRFEWCAKQLKQQGLEPTEQNIRGLIEQIIDSQMHNTPEGYEYVYALRYPKSMGGKPFYIGKGSGERYKDHAMEARRGVQSAKCDVIRYIWEQGEQVEVEMIYEHLTSGNSLLLEKEVIYQIGYENLTNVPPRTKDRSYRGEKTMRL